MGTIPVTLPKWFEAYPKAVPVDAGAGFYYAIGNSIPFLVNSIIKYDLISPM